MPIKALILASTFFIANLCSQTVELPTALGKSVLHLKTPCDFNEIKTMSPPLWGGVAIMAESDDSDLNILFIPAYRDLDSSHLIEGTIGQMQSSFETSLTRLKEGGLYIEGYNPDEPDCVAMARVSPIDEGTFLIFYTNENLPEEDSVRLAWSKAIRTATLLKR